MQVDSPIIPEKRDHGGGIDAAAQRFGGTRSDWLDLSTGINPTPYPFTTPDGSVWFTLPDAKAMSDLIQAAKEFWKIPARADILPVPGVSAAIAQIPGLFPPGTAYIPGPTYNEHEASFAEHQWHVKNTIAYADVQVLVHPNNPTGKLWSANELTGGLRIIDESFCDVAPEATLVMQAERPDTLILKSFGKFWGLAGLRLGFVIGSENILRRLESKLGPWAVSGPALAIGQQALMDRSWARTTRIRLAKDAATLDMLMGQAGARLIGGCSLFRLYEVDNARNWQNRLAQNRIWTRIFPYSKTWLRVGLPPEDGWAKLKAAL